MPGNEQQQSAATIAQQAVATTPVVESQVTQPAPAATPVVGAAPSSDATPAAPVETSFPDEDAKLAAALAEQAEVERKAKEAEGSTSAAPAAGSAATAPATGTLPAGSAASSGSPAGSATQQAQHASQGSQTAAIIALRKRATEERDGRLLAEGRAQALEAVVRSGGQPGGEQQQQQAEAAAPTFASQRQKIDDDVIALATQFEEGKLTATEWKRKETELSRLRDDLVVQEATASAVSQAAPGGNNNANDLGLEQHLTRLVGAFPILAKLNAKQLEPFYALAYETAAIEGVVIPDTAQGTVMLRERMAALAEDVYDKPAAARRRATAGQPGGAAAAQPGANPAGGTGGQPRAQPSAAQRAAKLNVAASQPPDLSSIGSGAQAGELNEANVEARLKGMSEDAQIKFLDANPGFVSKVMGGRTQRA